MRLTFLQSHSQPAQRYSILYKFNQRAKIENKNGTVVFLFFKKTEKKTGLNPHQLHVHSYHVLNEENM